MVINYHYLSVLSISIENFLFFGNISSRLNGKNFTFIFFSLWTMEELGTRCTTERVEIGNSLPTDACACALLDRRSITDGHARPESLALINYEYDSATRAWSCTGVS